jgi:hypothetical protein
LMNGVYYQTSPRMKTSQKMFTSLEDSFSFLFPLSIQEKLSGD